MELVCQNRVLLEYRQYILSLVDCGGPSPSQYEELECWYCTLWNMLQSGEISRADIRHLWATTGDVYSSKTVQGHACQKPYGYAGDYEIIDKIYLKWVTHDPCLSKWDVFFHSQAAPQAVRNRKTYFLTRLRTLENENAKQARVLNVASGPSRDIYEYLSANPDSRLHFDCIDMEPKAIEFSQALLGEFSNRVTFTCQNVFRMKGGGTFKAYDLVWSAGLFDYLEDRAFIVLLKKLDALVAPGGELVIGNISLFNPTRAYMEFGEWCLNYRSEQHLIELTELSGLGKNKVYVDSEPEQINLFLHMVNE